jgi:hypothetical protein
MRTLRSSLVLAALAGGLLAMAAGSIAAAADPAPTTVTMISVEPAVVELHHPVTFAAQVLPANAPAMRVFFLVDNSTVGIGVMDANGIATLTVNEVAGTGPHSVVAHYEGMETFPPAASDPFPFTVVDSRQPITVTLAPVASPVVRSDPVALHASLDPVPVDGTMSFRWTGIPIIPDVPVLADGTAEVQAPLSWLGTWPLTACYRGSATYQETCSPPVEVEVITIPTTTTISVTPTTIYPDEPFTVSVDVDPAPPAGAQARMWPGPMFALDAAGHADVTYTPDEAFIVPLGEHHVTVSFSGTARLSGSESNVVDVTVRRDPTTLELWLTEGAEVGDPITITARVTPVLAGRGVGVYLAGPAGTGLAVPLGVPIGPDGSGSITVDTDHWPSGTWDVQGSWEPGVRWAGTSVHVPWVLSDPTIPVVHDVHVAGDITVGSSVVVGIDCDDGVGSGVTTYGISNDGAAWTDQGTRSAFPWTLVAGSGLRTVHARCRDQAGNWSEVMTRSVLVDAAYGRASAVTSRPSAGRSVRPGQLPVNLLWNGLAGSPTIAGYRVQQRVDGGAWHDVGGDASSSVRLTVRAGHTYEHRVQAIDMAGNGGVWTRQAHAVRVAAWQETSRGITYHGAWRTRAVDGAWGGGVVRATSSRATATLRVSARGMAWVARRGPGLGTATVFVNGRAVARVNLASTSWTAPQVVWSRSWATVGTRSVTIRADSAKVEIDGFYALR